MRDLPRLQHLFSETKARKGSVSYRGMASRVTVTPGAMQKVVETPRDPHVSTVVAIADALNISPEKVFNAVREDIKENNA